MATLLQINISANRGSTGIIAESIGLLAIKYGWESYIAFGGKHGSSQSHLIRVGNRINRYLHFVEQRIRDNEGLCSRIVTKRLIRRIKEIKPDIVHLHNIHDHYLNYQLLFEFLNQTDIKVVWTFHDCWAFTGHCFHYVSKKCARWKSGCYDCPLRKEYPNTCTDRSTKNYALKKSLFTENNNLHIVAVSEWLAEQVRQSFLKEKDIKVINNGIDLDVFHPMPIRKKTIYRILGVSSVWNSQKGLYDFYRLRELLDSDSYEIVLIGLTKEQIGELPVGIIGVERTNSWVELAEYYSSSNILVNPTYSDTFPTVNLEALACGTPVITYKTGGCPETIDTITGAVVTPGDVETIAKLVELFCSNGRDFYSEACRRRAVEKYEKNDCFTKYISNYQLIMGGESKYLILAVASSWNESKGLSDYAQLSTLLKPDEVLVLIGVGEKARNKLPKSIIALPRTNSMIELAMWYNYADVVLSLSKAETFGMTIVEGMACGTPVIVYNNTAQPELVSFKTGEIAETSNLVDVYAKIQNIRDKGKKYYAGNCRERAIAMYNKECCYDEYLKNYKRLIQ